MLTRMEASCEPLFAAPTLSGCVPRDLTLCARLISSALALAATWSTSYQLAARSTLATSGAAPSGTASALHEGVPAIPATQEAHWMPALTHRQLQTPCPHMRTLCCMRHHLL